MPRLSIGRRRVLAGAGSLIAALSGCSGDEGGTGRDDSDGDESSQTASQSTESTTTPTAQSTVTDATGAADSDTTGTASAGELDLREANVVGVAFERADGGYRFDVTLYHDDDGEAGYANWWQVETLGGERLGRRDLLHAHGTREFTRSGTVAVPDDVTRVVVRGHDETHGYGGQAMVVDLETGAVTARRQGPEPQSFDEEA